MSNKCTCSPIPFTLECHYCFEKLYKYIHERDIEIIKIKNENIKENKCKCIYFSQNCLYTCHSCTDDFNKWKNSRIN